METGGRINDMAEKKTIGEIFSTRGHRELKFAQKNISSGQYHLLMALSHTDAADNVGGVRRLSVSPRALD